MKRTGFKRKPSKRNKNTERRKRERAKARRAKQLGPESFAPFVRNLPCVCGEHGPPSDPHHEPPKSRGGSWKDVSPVKRCCHTTGPEARHTVGPVTFWARIGKTYQQSNAETQEKWAARDMLD